jgi:transcriptional regulator with XRE-family HTH domain
MNLGERIRKEREARQIPLDKVFAVFGITKIRLTLIEADPEGRPATMYEMEKIAQALKIELEEVLLLSLEPAETEGKTFEEMRPSLLKLLKLFKDR